MEQKRTASLQGIRSATGCRVASCLPETTPGCGARVDVFVEQEAGERLLLLIIYQGIVSPNGNSPAERSYGGCFMSTSTQSRIQGFEYSGAVRERRHWFASDSLHSLIWSCVHPSFHSFIPLFLSFHHYCFSPLPGPPVWPVCLALSPLPHGHQSLFLSLDLLLSPMIFSASPLLICGTPNDGTAPTS